MEIFARANREPAPNPRCIETPDRRRDTHHSSSPHPRGDPPPDNAPTQTKFPRKARRGRKAVSDFGVRNWLFTEVHEGNTVPLCQMQHKPAGPCRVGLA